MPQTREELAATRSRLKDFDCILRRRARVLRLIPIRLCTVDDTRNVHGEQTSYYPWWVPAWLMSWFVVASLRDAQVEAVVDVRRTFTVSARTGR